MREHFSKEVIQLKQMVCALGADAEYAVNQAISAVEMHDETRAKLVIEGDYKIDCEEVKIEEECLKILALYQPVAGDLRLVITLLKVNNEIERIGDMAVSIAERALDMAPGMPAESGLDFGVMAAKSVSMLKRSLDSLISHNALLALEVIREDDTVDQLHRKNYVKVRDFILQNPKNTAYYLNCLTVSRNLERIADIATNICEDIVYLEQGKIVRHVHEM